MFTTPTGKRGRSAGAEEDENDAQVRKLQQKYNTPSLVKKLKSWQMGTTDDLVKELRRCMSNRGKTETDEQLKERFLKHPRVSKKANGDSRAISVILSADACTTIIARIGESVEVVLRCDEKTFKDISDKSYKLLDKSRNADAVDSAAGHLRTAEVLCPDNSCVLFMIQRLQAVAFVKTVKRAKSNENQMVEVHVWFTKTNQPQTPFWKEMKRRMLEDMASLLTLLKKPSEQEKIEKEETAVTVILKNFKSLIAFGADQQACTKFIMIVFQLLTGVHNGTAVGTVPTQLSVKKIQQGILVQLSGAKTSDQLSQHSSMNKLVFGEEFDEDGGNVVRQLRFTQTQNKCRFAEDSNPLTGVQTLFTLFTNAHEAASEYWMFTRLKRTAEQQIEGGMENGVGQLMIEGIDNAARAEVERLITSVKNITSMIDEKRKTNIHAARRELKNLNGMEIFRDEVLPDSVPLVISRARSVVSELVPIAAKPMKKDEPPTADFEATVNQYILAIGAVNDYDALRWAMEKLFDRCANLMIASQLKKVDDAIAEGNHAAAQAAYDETGDSFCEYWEIFGIPEIFGMEKRLEKVNELAPGAAGAANANAAAAAGGSKSLGNGLDMFGP